VVIILLCRLSGNETLALGSALQKGRTMPRFAANISMLFAELPFLDRFQAARDAGFPAVEFQAPYAFQAAEIGARVERAGLPVVLMNAPMGDAKAGERGLAAQPGRESDFLASIETALNYAKAFGCRQMHVLAGRNTGERAAQEALYVANLRRAADLAAKDGVTLLIEPLNLRDNPGYFLTSTGMALALLDRSDPLARPLCFIAVSSSMA